MTPIKRRNMLLQVLLMLVTLGLYWIYWFYCTSTELKAVAQDEDATPTLWTILLFIPFGPIYSYYKYSELYAQVATEKLNKWIILILWFFFAPAVWFLVQRDLNQIADRGGPMGSPAVAV